MENNGLKLIVEAMLFASERPLTIAMFREILETIEPAVIQQCVDDLIKDYEESNRSFTIQNIAGGFQLMTHPKYAPYLKKMFQQSRLDRMSRPTLETLAIIAYKQPVTRAEIEQIRGVNSDNIVRTLLEKGLIKIAGRRETLGRPFTYSTTGDFLELFGLGSIKDLPMVVKPEELPTLEPQLGREIFDEDSAGEMAVHDAGGEYDAVSAEKES